MIDEESAKLIATQFLGQYHNVVKIEAALGGGHGRKAAVEAFGPHDAEDNRGAG